MKSIVIFQPEYYPKDPRRAEELHFCRNYMESVSNDMEGNGCLAIRCPIGVYDTDPLTGIEIDKNATFAEAVNKYKRMQATNNDIDTLYVVANSDMIIDFDTLIRCYDFLHSKPNVIFALSRWDMPEFDMNTQPPPFELAKHFDWKDSQDTWMWTGNRLMDAKGIGEFEFGIPGCDNRFAYELSQYGEIYNPSIDIKTYHIHATNVRTYNRETVVPSPYAFLNAIKLDQIN